MSKHTQTRLGGAIAGLTLALAFGSNAFAAPESLEGRWVMAPALSSFREAVTGPAPDKTTLLVTRDDSDRLVYELIESREGAVVARGVYDLSFAGRPSRSSVDGATLAVKAVKAASGEVDIRAPAVAGYQALIRLRRTGPNTALIEHDVESADGLFTVDRISLVRAADASN